MIDSHCHIQFNGFKDDYEQVIKKCAEKDCVMFTVGTQKDTSKKAVEFAEKYDNIYATVGLHPIHSSSTEVDEEETSFISREEEFDYEYYKKLATHPKVVGIGECGLELFHIAKDKNRDEILEKQKKGFEQQIKLARELNLPMSIHIRDAYEETLNLLHTVILSTFASLSVNSARRSEESLSAKGGPASGGNDNSKGTFATAQDDNVTRDSSLCGVIHCYTGDWLTARKFLDLGFYLGFTGVITFPPKKTNPKATTDLLEVIKNCPLDRILVETDAPYLAPQAYRGQRCEPWMVEEVIKKIAEIKMMNYKEFLEITIDNTKKLFTKIS